jgi:hypothetical protein
MLGRLVHEPIRFQSRRRRWGRRTEFPVCAPGAFGIGHADFR